MNPDYWSKQGTDPLFPDMHWSRPENRSQSGKLLIIGGHAQGFAAPADAYAASTSAGIGTARVILPDKLQRMVQRLFPAAEYAPSTPSGSLAVSALAELLAGAAWADAVLLPGDIGHNSETAILLERFTAKFHGPLALAGDSLEQTYVSCLGRPDTLFVLNFVQLQKLAQALHSPTPVTSTMGMLALVKLLHDLTGSSPLQLLLTHAEHIFVAVGGQVSTTPLPPGKPTPLISLAATATVWWLQNPARPFEALTTAIHKPNN